MSSPRDKSRRYLELARRMRTECTEAEARLWSIVRSRSLAGFKFRRQHPLGGYILDFYCVKRKLAVELDGGQHGDPHHAAKDARRTRRLIELGVRVLRFWDHDMLKEPHIVAEEILRRLTEEEPSPRPSPGVPGEGE
jgi:very-short-patch-repair endonuclease